MNGQSKNLEDILQIWPEWKIFRKIGIGSYGSVYEIHREIGGHLEKAALKVIHIPQDNDRDNLSLTNDTNSGSEGAYYESQVEEIQHEIVVMQQFIGYTNIVSYEDYLIHRHAKEMGWDILIRMELLTPLPEHLKSCIMSENDVLQLGLDISQALRICHEGGIIHRDIKPQNIFINQRNCFKLGDFGIAKELPDDFSFSSFKGTISYMAPETFALMHTDERSDIYSLALVMYRILNNGRAPFLGEGAITEMDRRYAQRRRLTGESLPPPARAGSGMHSILSTALAGNPDDRYQKASQFHDALLSLQKNMENGSRQSTPERAFPINTGSVSPKQAWGKAPISVPGMRSTTLIAAAALALVLMAGGIAGSRLLPKIASRNVQNGTAATEEMDAAHGSAASESNASSASPAPGETDAEGQFPTADSDSQVTSTKPTVQTTTADPDEQINFPDPALEQAVRSFLTVDADQILTRRDVMDITSINLSGNGKAEKDRIVDLTGLSAFSSLEDLDLRYNHISNIEEISKLTQLRRVNLENNRISDLSPVNSLQTLRKLEVAYNNISDLTPILSMNKLELLDVRYNSIISIKGIGRMMKLKTLRIGHNQITDISPVSELTNLKSLGFGYNPVEDISALYKLPMLHVLTMNGCLVRDIGPVAFMPELSNLQIKGNPIEDYSPLGQLPKGCDVEADR